MGGCGGWVWVDTYLGDGLSGLEGGYGLHRQRVSVGCDGPYVSPIESLGQGTGLKSLKSMLMIQYRGTG